MAATTPALSLDDWYSQYAPLSDAQRVSVSRVSAWVSTQADRADAALQESDSAPPPRATSLTHRLASIAAQQAQALHPDDTHEMDLLQDGVRELDSLTAQVAELQASMAQLRAGLAFVQDSSSDLMGQASHYLHDQVCRSHSRRMNWSGSATTYSCVWVTFPCYRRQRRFCRRPARTLIRLSFAALWTACFWRSSLWSRTGSIWMPLSISCGC